MKILVVTFSFGIGTTASGFSTSKIITELAKRGHEICIITGKSSDQDYGPNVVIHKCNPAPLSPARFFKFVGNIIGVELNYIFWEYRARKLGRVLIKNSMPDIIYGRSSPIAGLTVAEKFSNEFGIPFVAHFADPIPAPEEWVSNRFERKKLLNCVTPIIARADLLSFVTKEMMTYQEFVMGTQIADKSFISPNSISEIKNSTPPPIGEETIFLFLGSFFGNRKPDMLLKGFDLYCRDYPNSIFYFYGVNQSFVEKFILSDRVRDRLRFFPHTDKPFEALEKAHVLVDVDGLVKKQVFLSSKLLDYLSINRFILAITTNDSPSSQLIKQMPNSTILVSHDPVEIAQGMATLALKAWDSTLFNERKTCAKGYYVSSVVDEIEVNFKSLLNIRKLR